MVISTFFLVLSPGLIHLLEGKTLQVKRAFKKSDEDGGLPYKPRKPKTPFVHRPRLPESKPHVTSPTFPTTPTPIVPWLLWPFHHGMNYSIVSIVTRSVLNEYYKARSTKNYGLHCPSP